MNSHSPRPQPFRYTANRRTLYVIPVDRATSLEVVGDSDNGSYEWTLVTNDEGITEHSNCGYGTPEVALRDGLIAYLGAPEAA